MNASLLKHLGNIDQLCGIRESILPDSSLRITEVYNAAGLRYTLLPDRCMDIYELSYKGINLSFQSKNGLSATFSPADGEFIHQWPGGALYTCGLDNVGGHTESYSRCPTHGRIHSVGAKHFGTSARWEENDYRLRAEGEMHQTRLYGHHLSLHRSIETGLNDKSLRIRDVITNYEADSEAFMLLYHCNFGYPLLQSGSEVAVSKGTVEVFAGDSADHIHMTGPVDGKGEELFLHKNLSGRAAGVLYNRSLGLGVYVAFDTAHLPNLLE